MHIFNAVFCRVRFVVIFRYLHNTEYRPKQCDDVSDFSPDEKPAHYKGGEWSLSAKVNLVSKVCSVKYASFILVML